MSDPQLNPIDRGEDSEGFVRERIINKSSHRKAVKKILLTAVCGILFGVLAGVSLAAVFPAASEWFAPEETQPSISIPKDETPEAVETEAPTPEAETAAPMEGTEPSTEGLSPTEEPSSEDTQETQGLSDEELLAQVQKMLDSALEQWSEDPVLMEHMYRALAVLGRNYNKALVTIVMKDVETDWFENQVETSGECAGIIWNLGQDGSLYILSGGVLPEEGVELQVKFFDGSRRAASLCGADEQTGMMILKVDSEQVDEQLMKSVSVLPLGNSYMVTKGKPVLVIGSLVGEMGAVIPAVVTYTEEVVIIPDGLYRKMYLDCSTLEGTTGFAVSLDGTILGIITPETSGSVTGVMGISDLKGVLELLANGQQVPYLGIVGQTVTEDIQEQYGLPAGVYINEVVLGSPAYDAGIKAGDVLVKIGPGNITGVQNMRGVIEELSADEVTVVVMRAGNGEYQQLEFKVVPGLR